MLKVGEKAPDFELQAYHQGTFKQIKLADYAGKWVILYFYPADFTFVWPTELTAVAAQYTKIKNLGAEILAISVDTVFAHKTWHEQELSKMVKGGLPYPMLSDPGGKLGATYEVYNSDAGLHNRGQFIIDPDGVIQAIEVLNAPVGRNVDELMRQIEAFQCVRESKGTEAIPAGWQPGKKTLKPGPDLVCKVCTVWDSDWKSLGREAENISPR